MFDDINNDTSVYMYCFYSDFGQEFMMAFNKLHVIAHYMGDYNYRRYKTYEDFLNDNIIISIIDTRRSGDFDKHMLFINSHKSYIASYPIDDNYYAIVFKLDKNYSNSLKFLKLGKFSKMYSPENIESFFKKHKTYYLKYKTAKGDVNVTLKNCISVINDGLNYENITISPYHVLSKSEGLQLILECFYNCIIDKNVELKSKINIEREILNYSSKVINNKKICIR